MVKKILRLLKENARMSLKELAARAGGTSEAVEKAIAELEARQIIQGYTAIVNESALPEHPVRAIIEVKVTPRRDGGFDEVAKRIGRFPEVSRLYLVSGGYDLLLEIEGDTLQEVASFVSERLSTIDGVLSTSTSFQLKKYKESGRLLSEDGEYERLKICP